jgi:hypothetical protein
MATLQRLQISSTSHSKAALIILCIVLKRLPIPSIPRMHVTGRELEAQHVISDCILLGFGLSPSMAQMQT